MGNSRVGALKPGIHCPCDIKRSPTTRDFLWFFHYEKTGERNNKKYFISNLRHSVWVFKRWFRSGSYCMGAGDQLLAGCYSWQCSGAFVEEWYPLASPTERNCADYTAECVVISSKTIGVASCKNCNPGYKLKMGNSNISACSDNSSGYDDADGTFNTTGSCSYSN